MSLLFHSTFNENGELFTFPFVVDEQDKGNLSHTTHQKLNCAPRLLLTMNPHNNQKKRSRNDREPSASPEMMDITEESFATDEQVNKRNKVLQQFPYCGAKLWQGIEAVSSA